MLGSNGSAAAVALSSKSVSHAFEPRTNPVYYPRIVEEGTVPRWDRSLPPNPYLCQRCNLAEAAHLETLSGEQR